MKLALQQLQAQINSALFNLMSTQVVDLEELHTKLDSARKICHTSLEQFQARVNRSLFNIIHNEEKSDIKHLIGLLAHTQDLSKSPMEKLQQKINVGLLNMIIDEEIYNAEVEINITKFQDITNTSTRKASEARDKELNGTQQQQQDPSNKFCMIL